MEQCGFHTDVAVDVGELKVMATRNATDIQALWTSHHEMQDEIKKMLTKIAYIVGGIQTVSFVLIALLDFLKK